MSRKKIYKNVDARNIVDRIMKISGLKQYEVADKVFEIKDKNLSNIIKRNTIDFFAIIKWAGNENVDLCWLLSGERKITPEGAESDAPIKAGYPLDEDPVVAELLEVARKVLTCGNQVAVEALERNIRYFAHTIEVEISTAEMKNQISTMKSEIFTLKETVGKWESLIDKEKTDKGPSEPEGSILKKKI